MFEKATRYKFRFQTTVGLVSAEDLWDLPLLAKKANGPCLDEVARTLSRQIKASADEESFVTTSSSKESATLEEARLKLELVKHIIKVRRDEATANENAKAKASEKRRLLELLARKREGELEALSIDEIESRIKAL